MGRAYSHNKKLSSLFQNKLIQSRDNDDDVNCSSGDEMDSENDSDMIDSDQERCSEFVFGVSLIQLGFFFFLASKISPGNKIGSAVRIFFFSTSRYHILYENENQYYASVIKMECPS